MANAERIQENNAKLRECIEMAEELPDAGTSVEVLLQSKTVTPTKAVQEVTADAGYTGLEKAIIEAIPAKYIVPSGTKEITENGAHDVTEFSKVVVNVPARGTKEISLETITSGHGHEVASFPSPWAAVGTADVFVKAADNVFSAAELEGKSLSVEAGGSVMMSGTIQSGHLATDGTGMTIAVNGLVIGCVFPAASVGQTVGGTTIKSAGIYLLYSMTNGQALTTTINIAGTLTVPDAGTVDPSTEYQRVQFITSAEEGTYPYLMTDFYADNSSGVEVIASFPTLQDKIPMGSRENNDATRFYCVYPLSANSIYYGFNTGSSISCQLKVDTIYRMQTNFLNSRLVNVYDENGARKGGGAISSTLSPAHSIPVSIFGYNAGASGTVNSKREFEFYGARCSRGHLVVREYLPVRRKSDGAVGLYERVTGQFLNGNGEFVAGADVAWDWEAA